LATAEQKRFPGIEARGLDGRRYRIPGDFEDETAILVVAFHRSQQHEVDGWMPALLAVEARHPGVRVYELPTISRSWSPLRWMIDGGMTRGIPDPAARARTLTAYTDVDRVVEALGLGGTDEIAIAVVGAKGIVLRQAGGDFDEAKLADLVAALPA
jgi:hypothetical protein